MSDFLRIDALSKNYANGFEALKTINLRVEEAEILALLGPNGAGKTTLISTICGISKFTSGKITLAGHDIVQNYRAARKMIGICLLYTSPSPRDVEESRMPSSA